MRHRNSGRLISGSTHSHNDSPFAGQEGHRAAPRYALKNSTSCDKDIRDFGDRCVRAVNYGWPGNVRELENVVEYAVNMEMGKEIMPENLPDKILRRQSNPNGRSGLKEKLDEYQRVIIEECLNETGRSTEDKIIAAKRLGISESIFFRRIRELGIRG